MSFKMRPEKIMIFVEGSQESILAAQYAVCMAKWLDCTLVGAYVVDIKTLEELTRAKIFVKMEEMDYEKSLEEDGHRYLNYVRNLAEAKGVFIETEILKGEIYKEIIRIIEQEDIDILVMGELEEPESRRDFYYNESERTFRHSPCPVIVVKSRDEIKWMYENL